MQVVKQGDIWLLLVTEILFMLSEGEVIRFYIVLETITNME